MCRFLRRLLRPDAHAGMFDHRHVLALFVLVGDKRISHTFDKKETVLLPPSKLSL